MSDYTCRGTRTNGLPCRATLLDWRGYCRHHIPDADLYEAAMWVWEVLGEYGPGCRHCLVEAMAQALDMKPWVADRLLARLEPTLGIETVEGTRWCGGHPAVRLAGTEPPQPPSSTRQPAFDEEEEILRAAAVIDRLLADGERHHWKNEICATVAAARGLAPRAAGGVAYKALSLLEGPYRLSWSGSPGDKRVRRVAVKTAQPPAPVVF